MDANGKDDVPLDFHDLRRSFASALEDRGTPRPVVQALLGHATGGGVIDVYVLVGPEAIERATTAIDSYLKEVLKAEAAARPLVEENRRQRLAAQRERMKRAQAAGRARKRKEAARRPRTEDLRKAG